MSPNKPEGIKVNIMGQQHQIACPQGQEDALQSAATYLDKKFLEVKQQSGIRNNERVLLMTALNLSHELLQLTQGSTQDEQRILNMITRLTETINT